MPWAGVEKLKLAYDSSRRKYPDIQIELGNIPTITITDEWRKQNIHERRKRLVHEVIGHLSFGWEHNNLMDKIGFSTYPNKDTMSKRIYNDLLKEQIKHPQVYIKEALK